MVQSILTAWRRFAAGCWLDHGDWIRERRTVEDREGVYTHVCNRCGETAEILPGQVYRARTRLPGRRAVRAASVFRRRA